MITIENNKDYIYLPNNLAEEIYSLNLKPINLGRVFKFLKILMMKSKRDNDSDIFCYTELPYNYLAKIFGKNYKKDFLSVLLDKDIIQSNGKYSKKNKKSLKYKINSEKWRKIIYGNVINGSDVIIINNSVYPIMSPLPDYQVLMEVGFTLSKEDIFLRNEDREYDKNIKMLHLDESGFINKTSSKIKEISLANYLVREDNLEEVIPIRKSGEIKYSRKYVALERAKSQNKVLVKDGRIYRIVDPHSFLEKKKNSKYCSDINSSMELVKTRLRSSRNDTNRRLDTNITNMSSYLVEYIMEENGLVEIDLCNSQLAISTLLINNEEEDYGVYKNISLGCMAYEYIQDHFNLDSRNEAKQLVFNIFFSSHKNRGEKANKMRELFPSVVKWIEDYQKEYGDNQFAILLQRKESEIFIDSIYESLKLKGIFVLTKHDSLIVRKEDEGLVRDIMQEYFDEINFKVMLR